MKESPLNSGRTPWLFTKRVLRVMAVVYLVIILLLTFFESRLVFPGAYRRHYEHDTTGPTAWSAASPENRTSIVTGHWIEHPSARHTVIFFHGNGTNATRQIPWGRKLSQVWKANVLLAEYRSFTNSEITPNERNVTEDALAAFDGLCESKKIRPEDIIVYGRSLGGGCAAYVASRRPVRALAFDRTFDSAVKVAADRFPFVPVRWLMRNQFDSVAWLSEYNGPVVQVHGKSDRVVPFENGKRLHQMIDTPNKHLITLEAFGHLDPMPTAVLDEMIEWLEVNTSLN
ncbi:MAG: alpha/beta hydrolase [Planctomycetota bacterium]